MYKTILWKIVSVLVLIMLAILIWGLMTAKSQNSLNDVPKIVVPKIVPKTTAKPVATTNNKQLIDNIFEYITAKYCKVPVELATVIAETTVKLCKEYNIDPYVIVGLIEVESSFNPFAMSKAHARGLLQVRYNIWKDTLKLKDHFHLHSVHIGIESGIRVLLIYLQKSNNNLTKALQKYNGSKGTVFSDKVYAAIGKFHSFNNKNKYSQEEVNSETN